MSVSQPESGAAVLPDFSSMTEEEQIAYAMQMSLAGGGEFCLIIIHIQNLDITFTLTFVVMFIMMIGDLVLNLYFIQNMEKWRQGPLWIPQNQQR